MKRSLLNLIKKTVSGLKNLFLKNFQNILTKVDFRDVSDATLSESIRNYATQTHKSLNLKKGFLVRAILFDCGKDRPQRLLLSIHHLICDGFSLIILREHLESIYTQISKNKIAKLPPSKPVTQRWISALNKFTCTKVVENELNFWVKQLKSVRKLPSDFCHNGPNIEDQIVVIKNEEETTKILKFIKFNQLEIRDYLLSLFISTIFDWTGVEEQSHFLTGHGREQVVSKIDVSQSMVLFCLSIRSHLNITAKLNLLIFVEN